MREINLNKIKWVNKPEHLIYRNKEFIMTIINGVYVSLNSQDLRQAFNYMNIISEHIDRVKNDINKAAVLEVPFYHLNKKTSKTYQIIYIK